SSDYVAALVDVMLSVSIAPDRAVIISFLQGPLRNMLGLVTLLAFPGGMVGAFLAGWLYRVTDKKGMAALGEAFGTGIIGSLFAVPFARILLGSSAGAFFFMPSFLVSSISGALIGWFVVSRVNQANLLENRV